MTSTAWGGFQNGQIPLEKMSLVRGEHFEPEAAAQLLKLEAAFQEHFGKPAIILEGYRSLATQQQYWADWQAGKPGAHRAAYPGTSNHGYGRAADFASSIDLFDSAEHQWMVANAPTYGWHWGEAPDEAWHFTYYPGTAIAASESTPISATATPAVSGRKREDTMTFVFVDEQVVDVPGKAGVRNATYKTQRTWVVYGEFFYKEFTASQATANGFAGQMGNAVEVSREFLDSVQASQADARNKLAAAIAAAIKK